MLSYSQGLTVFVPESLIAQLPSTPTSSRKDEKILARKCELNCGWEEKFNHLFQNPTIKCPRSTSLCVRKLRAEKKQEDRIIKQNLASHINDQLKGNLTMSILAEGESISSYNHKRLWKSKRVGKSARHNPATAVYFARAKAPAK